MTVADEEDWIGKEMHVVPSLDPDGKCNGKKKMKENGEVVRNEDNHVLFGGYCNNKAGYKTDHVGEGRCTFHAGQAGAPAHNQNAQTHATTVDPHHYHESLPPEEKEFIEDTSAAILDRIRRRQGRDPDLIDEILSRRVAINLHILSKASDYTRDELVQVIVHDGTSHEETGALVEEVRRYSSNVISMLKQLGVLNDPESQKAEAIDSWRSFVDDSQSGDVHIEVDEQGQE